MGVIGWVIVAVLFVFVVVPQTIGLIGTLRRLAEGDKTQLK